MQHSLGCFSTLQYQKTAFLSSFGQSKWETFFKTWGTRFNEPLYNEILSITNDTLQPGQLRYGKEPRYNEPQYNEHNIEAQTNNM